MKRFLALLETKRSLLTAKYDMSSLNFSFPFFKSSFEGIWWAGYHNWVTWAILLLYFTERHKVRTSCKFVHFSDMVEFCIPVPSLLKNWLICVVIACCFPVPFLLEDWLIFVVIACCFPSWPRTHVQHWRSEPAATSGWIHSVRFKAHKHSGRI